MAAAAVGWCVLVVCWLSVSSAADSVQGTVHTLEEWKLIGNFTFLGNDTFEYKIVLPVDYDGMKLLIYYEEQIVQIRDSMSCSQKEALVKPEDNQLQIVVLRESEVWSGCISGVDSDWGPVYTCTASRFIRSVSTRKWFLAMSRCEHALDAPEGLKFRYYIEGGKRMVSSVHRVDSSWIGVTIGVLVVVFYI